MMFDGDNTYPDCQRCGRCCEINVLGMTADDYTAIQRAIEERGVLPIDYSGQRCCFQNEDRTCMIWDARPQVCRLHNCRIPRRDVLAMDPTITVDEDLWLVDLHANFVARQPGTVRTEAATPGRSGTSGSCGNQSEPGI